MNGLNLHGEERPTVAKLTRKSFTIFGSTGFGLQVK